MTHSSSETLLLTGGNVLTLSSDNPTAEAVLIRDGSIVAVGTDSEVEASLRAGEAARRVCLNGKTVVPGFVDSHIHLISMGMESRSLDLSGLSKSEIVDAVAERHRVLPRGEVLIGNNWDYPTCPNPTADDLDSVAPDRPVILMQFSAHVAWLNSLAMRRYGFLRSRAEKGETVVHRDSAGRPTGVISEPARSLRFKLAFLRRSLKRDLVDRGIEAALTRLSENGVTGVQDNTWFPWHCSRIRAADVAQSLTARISCWSLGVLRPLDFWFRSRATGGRMYSLGARKFFLDGAFSTHGAFLSEPYADDTRTRGAGLSADSINKFLYRSTRQQVQIACHSIGDAATANYLDAAESVIAATGGPEFAALRHRIEHAQLVREEDIERIARLGMVVSAQPHAASDLEKDERLLGKERADRAYPYRSLLEAGVPLAFGSDYPSEKTFAPLYGIHLAVNRESDEALTPLQALTAYTRGSAFADFAEHKRGAVSPGYQADLTVLDADPTTISPKLIKDIQVEMTIVAGRAVYERQSDMRRGDVSESAPDNVADEDVVKAPPSRPAGV